MIEQSEAPTTAANTPAPLTVRPVAQRAAPKRTFPRWLPLAGGIAGLALAALAEALVESKNGTQITLALYLVAIALFAVSAWPMPRDRVESKVAPAGANQGNGTGRLAKTVAVRTWAVLGAIVIVAVAIDAFAVLQLRDDLRSTLGAYLWIVSLIVLWAGTFAWSRWSKGQVQVWSPRWGSSVWPSTTRGRVFLVLALVAILAVAAAARLIALDRLPVGINADEGDRAAVSIQIIRGFNQDSIFSNGWYWISMLYFWLLAQLMKILGIGYTQARVFGALFSILSVGVITWIGMRHFSLRVGLIAGGILSLLAVSLQFARETSEAGPTATLWAISVAFFLEGARTGKIWAWTGAGLAGGFALYFYPSGRLWGAVAAIFCLYLLINGLGKHRAGILRGAAIAALASFMVMGPFIVRGLQAPYMLTGRAEETSIFTNHNTVRLDYVDQQWSMPQLLAAQTERAVGLFHEYSDHGGFWPTDKPIMAGLLAVLTLLGIGWVSTRWRDPRYVILAAWFWVGLSGVIVTVETPNLQRMATAVPVIALFPALVLNSLARRVEFVAGASSRVRARTATTWAVSGLAALVVLFIAWTQYNFYFVFYPTVDRWPGPNTEGKAVDSQGTDTLVVSLGDQEHMVNSGWIRLLAPNTPRAGIKSPGSDLPLAIPPDHNLSFMLYPKQQAFFPYLQGLYPGGKIVDYAHNPEGTVVTMYQITREQWAAQQGAMVVPADASGKQAQPVRVGALGDVPPGWTAFPAHMIWKAGLRVPQYWNYMFRIGPGPAKLTIDGKTILQLAEGAQSGDITVALARGDHFVEFQGTAAAGNEPAQFLWAPQNEGDPGNGPDPEWTRPPTDKLRSNMQKPQGLLNVMQIGPGSGRPEQRSIDNTLNTCCFADQHRTDGQPYTSTWTGTLDAPTTGTYSMTVEMGQATGYLKIDGTTVVRIDQPVENLIGGSIDLTAGPHQVEISANGANGPGRFQWLWTPPGGENSLVPPSVLAPPAEGAIQDEVPQRVLGTRNTQPVDEPLDIVH